MNTNHRILNTPPTRKIWTLDGFRPRRLWVWVDGCRVIAACPGIPGVIDGEMDSPEIASEQVEKLDWVLAMLTIRALRGNMLIIDPMS